MFSALRTEENVACGLSCELARKESMVGGPGAEDLSTWLCAGLWVERIELTGVFMCDAGYGRCKQIPLSLWLLPLLGSPPGKVPEP